VAGAAISSYQPCCLWSIERETLAVFLIQLELHPLPLETGKGKIQPMRNKEKVKKDSDLL
jgi:hypothetical protein